MSTESSVPEADADASRRVPAWLRTGWGKVVATSVGLGALVALITGVLSLTDRMGWTSPLPAPQDQQSVPVPSPTATAPPPGDPYNAGWGPYRDTFTTAVPAEYAVLNSIIDNPVYGDERNFVQVRLAEKSNAAYDDQIIVEPGDEVVVFVAVNNNASDHLTSSAGTIHGLTARATIGSNSTTEHWVSVSLAGKNALEVWDGAILLSREESSVELVSKSAYFHTVNADGGFAVDDPVGEGALLGLDRPDGSFPTGRSDTGMQQGSGYLTFRLRVVSVPS